MPEYYGKITAAAKYIEKNLDGRKPKIGLILGSGWGSIIGKIENGITVPYTDVPEMAVSTTPGHAGEWICGNIRDRCVLIMNGRLHPYEGHSLKNVVMPVYMMKELGVKTLIVTVKKDIKRMISKGWFLQGHVDKQETCLITSNETYDQYVSTQKRLEERDHQQDEERARQEAALRQQAEEKEKQKFNQRKQADARACVEAEREDVERAGLSPEVRQVLDKGNDFLDKIHRSNDAIPGEEISRKISRMELIIAKIFERAKAHPEIIPDLNRLMDYYLPMTVKLLNAYEEMDSQPVQGENITSSKKEIEETIDTLNVAFEKLLDSIFQDTAMDVSSDISVLNTVLAQEGLTEDELTRMRKEAEKNRL